jgi:hypothetical protein
MARRSPIQCVEAFHLVFLRVLETRLDRSAYAVKGGVNVRAWFGSPRYSEDLDIDVLAGESHVFRDKIDRLLGSAAFDALLRTQALVVVRATKPKQTETTQRWKFEILPKGGQIALHTKIELSRRGARDDCVFEPVLMEIVRPYGIPAPTANHYTAAAAMRQKIGALASRREPQARDIWDLEHLLRTTRADPRPLPPELRDVLPAAVERAMEMPFEDYKAQVVPFLAPEHQELFGTPEAWIRIRELVVSRLMELDS